MEATKPKRSGAARVKQSSAATFPPERAQSTGNGATTQGPGMLGRGVQHHAVTLQAGIAALEQTMAKAAAQAGLSLAEFGRLPAKEQNAFLAQARGAERTGADPRDERAMLQPRQCFKSPWNRKHFDDAKMEKLINSVREQGVLQEGMVRPLKSKEGLTIVDQIRYDELVAEGLEPMELVYGERRCRAAEVAGKPFPAKIRRNMSDVEAIELQGIENLEREDPNPIESAEKFAQLLEQYLKLGGNKEAAFDRIEQKLKVSRSAIYDGLKLLKLPEKVKEAAMEGKLPGSHARELAKLEHNAQVLEETADVVLRPRAYFRDDQFDKGDLEENGQVLSFRETKRVVGCALRKIENLKLYHAMREEWEKDTSKGLVVSVTESREIAGCHNQSDHWWIRHEAKNQNLIKADSQCSLPGANYRSYEKLWKRAPEGMLLQLENGLPVVVYKQALAELAVRGGGKLRKDSQTGRATSKSPAEREKEAKHRARCAAFRSSIELIVKGEESKGNETDREFWTVFFRTLQAAARQSAWKPLCVRRGWPYNSRACNWIEGKLAAMSGAQIRAAALELLLQERGPSNWGNGEWDANLLKACGRHRIDLEKLAKGDVQTAGQKPAKAKGGNR